MLGAVRWTWTVRRNCTPSARRIWFDSLSSLPRDSARRLRSAMSITSSLQRRLREDSATSLETIAVDELSKRNGMRWFAPAFMASNQQVGTRLSANSSAACREVSSFVCSVIMHHDRIDDHRAAVVVNVSGWHAYAWMPDSEV
ncbi:hypothetical protein OH77DRAFT_1119030 [Trametes cingulata]|nr:hypothetical protein OH77DRAFT_1119030 [Trametes cingulata]